MSRADVCVVGLGYVGLPTAALLAFSGLKVVGVDIRPRVLGALAKGETDLSEGGVRRLVAEAVRSGNLTGSPVPVPADAYVVAVPTPVQGNGSNQADLSSVKAACDAIASVLLPGDLVIVESTCPPGTTCGVVRLTLESGSGLVAGHQFHLAYCPERVLPGNTLQELQGNDRVVGGLDEASALAARSIYGSFVKGEIILTDATTAELVKLMENTHRDVNVALANEFALVSERLGIDVWTALELANRHPRVRMLSPGPGVGGHCIAVDPWFVVHAAPEVTSLIAASRLVNDSMPSHVSDRIEQAMGGLHGRRLVVLGLTYKADVDDIRESPSNQVIRNLRASGAEVLEHDCVLGVGGNVGDLVHDADGLLLLVNHVGYRSLDPASLGSVMRRRFVFDARNALSAGQWLSAGFTLVRLGDGRVRLGSSSGARP